MTRGTGEKEWFIKFVRFIKFIRFWNPTGVLFIAALLPIDSVRRTPLTLKTL